MGTWIDLNIEPYPIAIVPGIFHTLKFLHGIICIYKIDALIELFKWSVCNPGGLPFGEDAFAGIQAKCWLYFETRSLNVAIHIAQKPIQFF